MDKEALILAGELELRAAEQGFSRRIFLHGEAHHHGDLAAHLLVRPVGDEEIAGIAIEILGQALLRHRQGIADLPALARGRIGDPVVELAELDGLSGAGPRSRRILLRRVLFRGRVLGSRLLRRR